MVHVITPPRTKGEQRFHRHQIANFTKLARQVLFRVYMAFCSSALDSSDSEWSDGEDDSSDSEWSDGEDEGAAAGPSGTAHESKRRAPRSGVAGRRARRCGSSRTLPRATTESDYT